LAKYLSEFFVEVWDSTTNTLLTERCWTVMATDRDKTVVGRLKSVYDYTLLFFFFCTSFPGS